MSDEEIAKRCGLKVSDVRAVLNKLHEYGITTYARERDKDTGWFSYNWTVNVIKLYEMLGARRNRIAKKEEDALTYEKSYTFYTCKNATCTGSGQRIPETDAILTTYVCDRCGGSLQLFDNAEIIKNIEQRMATRLPDDQTMVKEFRQQVKAPRAPARKTAKTHSPKQKARKAARASKKKAKRRR